MSLFPPYKFSVFCNIFFGDALCRRRKILRFRYELRESSEDSDEEKTRRNACIQLRVFFFGCWTKSRDEIGRVAAYECGPQNYAYRVVLPDAMWLAIHFLLSVCHTIIPKKMYIPMQQELKLQGISQAVSATGSLCYIRTFFRYTRFLLPENKIGKTCIS